MRARDWPFLIAAAQALVELCATVSARPARGELNRQRKPFEPPADLDDRRAAAGVERKIAVEVLRAIDEQSHGISTIVLATGVYSWKRQTAQIHDSLCGELEALARGCQQLDPRCMNQHPPPMGSIEDVIARTRSRLKLAGFQLIDIAPDPCLPRLHRADQRVPNLLKVLGGMFVFR